MTQEPRIFAGESTISSVSVIGEIRTATLRRRNLDPYLMSYVKINSNWIKDLNIIPQAIKPL